MMPLFLFLFFLLMVAYAVLIGYYHKAWNKLPEFVVPEQRATTTLSVVIAARNEAANIEALLQSLHAQQYSKSLYEVIIVDDHSTDNTWQLLEEARFEGLKLIPLRLEEQSAGFKSYKK